MLELVVAVCLIAINGLFALSELAVVSARKPRLKAMADEGRRGAAQALRLAEDPGRFLSTVQIGITLVGILAGVFSGAGLSARLQGVFEQWGAPVRFAEPSAYALVIGAITYFSVVVGELVPKQVALRDPEAIACAAAPPMMLISRAAAPLIWLLDASARLAFRLFGADERSAASVTEQDVKSLLAEAETAGVIETGERAMISGVLRLGARDVREIMTPRTRVKWIDLSDEPDTIRRALTAYPHSRIPVAEGGPDRMIGVVETRDLLARALAGEPFDIRTALRAAPVLPDTVDALEALEALRDAHTPLLLVHDEYGHFEGIVTPADFLDAIAGEFRSDQPEPDAVRRKDGSWLLSGAMPADEMADRLGLALPPDRDYETVAGFVISGLKRMPELADEIETMGWRFEIVDLDGKRVDKVLASRPAPVDA
ncbi:MAG TPA: hemolysin family protein [Rhodoblastus sp.]|nr:hemolysin family protein [Rhodoblastus sp.]